MNLKVQFLHFYINYFPEIMRAYSEEQSERFHKDVYDIERRYQGRWNANMLVDYCWMIKRKKENGKQKCLEEHQREEEKVSQGKRAITEY